MPPKSRGDGGKLSRRAALALIAGGGILGLTGTGAFDTVNANRGFDVSTADDDSALLGFEKKQTSGVDGSTIELIELTNQVGQDLDSVSVEIIGSSGPIASLTAPDSLATDSSDQITADLSCGGRPTVDIRITASGSDQEVELIRSVEVNCITICGERTIPAGCVNNAVPKSGKDTPCSVRINKQNQYSKIVSNVTIGGALDVSNSGNQVDITLTDGTVISDYLKVDTSDQIDFDLDASAEIQNGAKFMTDSQIKPHINGDIGGGICIESGGVNNFSSDNGNIAGIVSIDSTSQVKLDTLTGLSTEGIKVASQGQVKIKKLKRSTIGGKITIDSPGGQVKIQDLNETTVDEGITISSDSQVNISKLINEATVGGDIDISSDSQVKISKLNSAVINGVTINSQGQVKIQELVASTVRGDINVDSPNGQVKIKDIEQTTIDGDVDISSDSQVTISLKEGATITGDIRIESDSQVKISLKDGTAIKGNVTIDTPSGVKLDCANIEGEITVNGSANPC